MPTIARPGRGGFVALMLAASIACGGTTPPAARTDAAPVDAGPAGTVRGRVTLVGTPPPATMLRLDGDRKCAALTPDGRRTTQAYVVGSDAALANVFVHVATGLEGRSFPIPQEPVIVDQQDCWYTPRVVGVRVGQPLQVLNSDALLHNVRAVAQVNEPFLQGQPVQGMRYSHTFSVAEVMVPLKCDVHAWMDAWVGVVNHPYFAVTGVDGAFALPNLPAGTYTVEAWHEAAGVTRGTVTVTGGGDATLALEMKVPTT